MTAWCQENENLHPSTTMLWNLKGETIANFSSMHAQPWKIDVGPEPLPTPPPFQKKIISVLIRLGCMIGYLHPHKY